MRRILLSAAAFAALGLPQAGAANISHQITMGADVNAVCAFPGPTELGGTSYFSTVSAAGSTLTIPYDAQNIAQRVTAKLAFLNASCNAPMHLTITSTPIVLEGGSPIANFDNEIRYSGTLEWHGEELAAKAVTEPGFAVANQEVEPDTGDLVLTIDTRLGQYPLMKGKYKGTLNLTLAPR